jgi:hypothetical protein
MQLRDEHFDRMAHHMVAAVQAAGADPQADIPSLRRNIDALRPDVLGARAPRMPAPPALPVLGLKLGVTLAK